MTSATTPLALQPWTARVARRARRAHARQTARGVDRASPSTRCDALDDAVDAVGGAVADAASRLPAALGERPYEVRLHTDTHLFPGLAQYDAIGAHFNVPAVLLATALTTGVGVVLASQLWERSFRQIVFPEEAAEERRRNAPPLTLCGVDCSAYPIFGDATVKRAVNFAARWHHGQYRRTGEPYVTHCVEAALILAAMLPTTPDGAPAKKKYVDAVAACVLHDVVDDTECDLEDVRAAFGDTVATLVADVSTLGKLPQILRRSQRRRAENAAKNVATEPNDGADLERESGKSSPLPTKALRLDADLERDAVREAGMTGRALKIAETRENFEGVDVLELASLRRMLWSLVRDPRCFLIKFADRIHNMRTAYAVDPTKAKFVANETLQVWCSFAEQLGMFGAKAEMEDLSFAVKDPESFRAVINARYDAWGVDGVEASRRRKKFAKRFESREAVRTVEGYAGMSSSLGDALGMTPTANVLASEASDASSVSGGKKAIVSGVDGDAKPPLRAKWTWEPPTGADVQMFFERIRRGENAGTPQDLRVSRADRKARAAAETARRVAEEARARALEEERLKRAKPVTPEQESLRALLACVPPFDVLRASNRSSAAAAAAAAATAAADAATAATVAGAGADASARAYADAQMGGASLEASLRALQKCRDTTLRSLQLDALAPGLRVDIKGRLKSAHSTHLKMRRKKVPFAQVCDARALRVVVGEPGEQPGTREEVMACYDLVEAIHKLYRPVDGESDDYISNPKPSGYQSLHTAVVGPDGALLEFQVRTRAMHEAAEFGDAAHWLYKDFIADADAAGREDDNDAGRTESKNENVSPFSNDSHSAIDLSVSAGQPVMIVRGARGERLAAGVVSWAEGSRMHVVEPARGDAFAPGFANAAGVVDVAEWVAMGLHSSLLERATASGRLQPRQTGRGYAVIEFALCSDGRWHQRDAYGRVLGSTVADPLDVDALLEALEASAEKTGKNAQPAASTTFGEDATPPRLGDEQSSETSDDVSVKSSSRSVEKATRKKIELGEGGTGGSVVANLASPDDEMVSLQVRAMQRALQAYLDDADDEAPDASYAGFGDARIRSDSFATGDVTTAAGAADASSRETDETGAGSRTPGGEEPKTEPNDEAEKRRREETTAFRETAAAAARAGLRVAERDLARAAAGGAAGAGRAGGGARKELRLSLDALALDAAAERRAKKRAAEAEALRSGERESPIFTIARAAASGNATPETKRPDAAKDVAKEASSPSGLFDAEDAAQMAQALSGSPSVTFDDENVLVVAWTRNKGEDGDETQAMRPELIEVPKGVTAAQISRGVAGDGASARAMSADADGVDGSSTDASFGSGMNNSVPELVNVNMEMVPADTPLKQGDQVFLGDER